ncbi:MAG: ATP-grasp domain-containing protein [Oligoflexia bacterium]|nr:ATP-grasp domain-containing protein [Oligoflexia bacterium]
MRPKLAQGSARHCRKVLVLGSPVTGRRIGEQLRELGYEPSLQEELGLSLPSIAEPDAPAKLRSALLSFLRSPASACGELSPCLHPGISAWAERPELATLGQELGFSVISPPARVLTLFANTLTLLIQGERLNIPHLLISSDPLHSVREIELLMARAQQQFPIILKSAKGSPGAGHLVVHDVEQLESKLPLWMEQVRMNCGEVMVLAERYLEGARLVSVPFVRFVDGALRLFPMIDASLQCRQRKMVEFCPVFGIDPAMETQLSRWTQELAESMGYIGAGSFDFLVDGSRAFLVGGVARLDTSFPLWERVAGVDAVAWQMAAAEGLGPEELPAPRPSRKWANGIAIRFYAEDPVLQLPQPGLLRELGERRSWSFPSGEAELDPAVEAGAEVSHELLGLLWVGAQERAQALTLASGVLQDVWFAGSLQTNERFVAELLSHPWVREGIFHAGFVDEEFLPAIRPPEAMLPVLAGACAALGRSEGCRWAVGDQWAKLEPSAFRWVRGPESWSESGVSSRKGVSGTVELAAGQRLRLCAYPVTEDKWLVRLGNWTLPVRRVPQGPGTKRQPRVLALVSGRVHSVLFRDGARVPAHEPLLIIESLGMLIPHALPVDVRIQRWKVAAEDPVRAGEELAEFEVTVKA